MAGANADSAIMSLPPKITSKKTSSRRLISRESSISHITSYRNLISFHTSFHGNLGCAQLDTCRFDNTMSSDSVTITVGGTGTSFRLANRAIVSVEISKTSPNDKEAWNMVNLSCDRLRRLLNSLLNDIYAHQLGQDWPQELPTIWSLVETARALTRIGGNLSYARVAFDIGFQGSAWLDHFVTQIQANRCANVVNIVWGVGEDVHTELEMGSRCAAVKQAAEKARDYVDAFKFVAPNAEETHRWTIEPVDCHEWYAKMIPCGDPAYKGRRTTGMGSTSNVWAGSVKLSVEPEEVQIDTTIVMRFVAVTEVISGLNLVSLPTEGALSSVWRPDSSTVVSSPGSQENVSGYQQEPTTRTRTRRHTV